MGPALSAGPHMDWRKVWTSDVLRMVLGFSGSGGFRSLTTSLGLAATVLFLGDH